MILAQITNNPQLPALPDSTASDIAKVFNDFGIHISVGTIGLALLFGIPFVKAMAAYARKLIPDSLQVNKLGLALAHVAGEMNPSIAKLGAAAVEQQIAPLVAAQTAASAQFPSPKPNTDNIKP